MIREAIGHALVSPEEDFRWRGGEITRLEGFSDAVFAFAVTLLVVSLEVPKTYDELVATMKGFVAFAICFGFLTQIWRRHYLYSRRYGLQTPYAIALNSILLFVVLFYVYPLKFLFTLVVVGLSGGLLASDSRIFAIQPFQVTSLVVIYSLGFTAVSGVFALLHQYAHSKKTELGLNEYESLRTRAAVVHHTADAALGVVVAAAAKLLPIQVAVYSGLLFGLAAVSHRTIGSIFGKQARRALEKTSAGSPASKCP